jgi:hypothetical protein
MVNEKIEVVYMKVRTVLGVDIFHETLVYTNANGERFIATAFTTLNPANTGALDVSQAAIDAANGKPSVWGTLDTKTGPITDFTNTQGGANWMAALLGAPGNPNPSEIVATGKGLGSLSAKWAIIEQTEANIKGMNLSYSPTTQNSNSVASTAQKAAGITPPTDNGLLSSHYAIAADNLLGTTLVIHNPDNSVTTTYADGSIVSTNVSFVDGSTGDSYTFAGYSGLNKTYPDGSSSQWVLGNGNSYTEALYNPDGSSTVNAYDATTGTRVEVINDVFGNVQLTTSLNNRTIQSDYTTAGGSYTNFSYNPDGSVASVVAYDANTGETITTATNSQGNLVELNNIDNLMNKALGLSSGSSAVFNGWNNSFSDVLVNTPLIPQIGPFVPGYNPADPYGFGPSLNLDPIGAFYESVTPALDLAPSIADKTPVLLGANNSGLSVSALTGRDTNNDGLLSGAELTGLNVWVDLNENGLLETGELRSLATAGISQIKSADYGFYTQGNAVIGTGVAAEPARPNESSGVPAAMVAVAMPAQPLRVNFIQAVPASNYATLRATDNTYAWSDGYYMGSINWAPTQIKVNYANQSYLIGTDNADGWINADGSFTVVNANYYSGNPIFNTNLLTNFLAGGGDDVFGGSIRADNLWGGLAKNCEAANDAMFEMRRMG